jgi:hypothetical protein
LADDQGLLGALRAGDVRQEPLSGRHAPDQAGRADQKSSPRDPPILEHPYQAIDCGVVSPHF